MRKNLILALLMLFTIASFGQEPDAKESDFGKNRFEGQAGYNNYSFNDFNGSEGGFNSYINYERLFGASGKLGLQVGMDINVFTESDLFSIGFGSKLNWYIMGEGKGVYVGPGFSIGSIGDSNGNYTETISSFGVNGGYQIQINKLFGVRASLGYDFMDFGGFDANVFKAGVGFNFSI